MAQQVTIIGAGIGGLALAQCLRRKNIPAVIYERVAAKTSRNHYGITLKASAYRPLLEAMKTDEDHFKRVVGVRSMRGDGSTIQKGDDLLVNRTGFENFLREGLDIRWEHKSNGLTGFGDSEKRTLDFKHAGKNRTVECGGLLVAADGVHSTVLKSLDLASPAPEPQVLPFVVFNGKRRLSRSNFPRGLETCFDEPDGVTYRAGDVFLQIKASSFDPEKGNSSISYTLSRPATDKDQALLNRTVNDAETFAKLFKEEVQGLGELPAPFGAVFNSVEMENDRRLHWLMRSSLLGDETAKESAKKGVIVIGDAAHAQPILGGRGAEAAISDAVLLARLLSNGDPMTFFETAALSWKKWKAEAELCIENLHSPGRAAAML